MILASQQPAYALDEAEQRVNYYASQDRRFDNVRGYNLGKATADFLTGNRTALDMLKVRRISPMKTTDTKRPCKIPVTLPTDIAMTLKAKADRESISPGTWLRRLLSLTFAHEYEAQQRQQQAAYAAMMRQNGGA